MNKRQRKRLLNVAKALYESPNPEDFTMGDFGYPDPRHGKCGTPACAFGHYAARPDLQRAFFLDEFGGPRERSSGRSFATSGWIPVIKHFGLTEGEVEELFGATGCDDARTPEAAAVYIEHFVENYDE